MIHYHHASDTLPAAGHAVPTALANPAGAPWHQAERGLDRRRRTEKGRTAPNLRVLTAPPPAYPLCHLLLTAEAWARSLCQPRPHSAFLINNPPKG